jgi:hypothetical protein
MGLLKAKRKEKINLTTENTENTEERKVES